MNKQAIENLLTQIQDANAQGDIIIDQSDSLSLKANAGALEEHSVHSSLIIGLRVIKEQRVGIAYSEASDPQSLHLLLQQALTNASYGEVNEHESINQVSHSLSTHDHELAPTDKASVAEKIDFVLDLESRLCKKENIQSVPYNNLTDRTSTRMIYSTSGLQTNSTRRLVSTYAYALAKKGDESAMSYSGRAQRTFIGLDADSIINETWQECLARLEGKPVDTGQYDVIFSADQQSDLFNVFKFALSGRAAKDGLNPWRDKLGTRVADQRLTLSDQPLLKDGLAFQPFDVEGNPCADTDIINNGQLDTLLHNTATANYFGIKSTAHANRSAKTVLGVSPHQLTLKNALQDNLDITEGRYLLINDLTGLHSGANTISGDFSFGASGYYCENGQKIQPVRGITIAGNFYQMLKEIVTIGQEQQWNKQRTAYMAPIRFAQLAISGD